MTLATTAEQPITLHKRPAPNTGADRWSVEQIEALLNLPFNDLLWRAQQVHRQHFDANEVELAKLGGYYAPDRVDVTVDTTPALATAEWLRQVREASAAAVSGGNPAALASAAEVIDAEVVR